LSLPHMDSAYMLVRISFGCVVLLIALILRRKLVSRIVNANVRSDGSRTIM
jgi:hypothetical protein